MLSRTAAFTLCPFKRSLKPAKQLLLTEYRCSDRPAEPMRGHIRSSVDHRQEIGDSETCATEARLH